MYLCGFVCLDVVAGANKVEGRETLASNMTFTRLKVKQGHFETAILILHNFSSFLRLKVFRSITLKYLYDSNADYSAGSAQS